MERLQPVIFNDAWGSHVAIASLRGQSIPSELPESELWLGAHESGPALLADRDGADLAAWVAEDPMAVLGPDVVRRFGARLPFLLKVLAPGKAISIQVHPTAEQARAVRGAGRADVYVDDWAKPELLLAIAPFEVFIGLRTRPQLEAFVNRLGVASLEAALAVSDGTDDPGHAFLAALLATPGEKVVGIVREIVAACVRVEAAGDEFGETAAAIVRVAEEHPDDIGIAVLVAMCHRVLQPGEFVDVAAGVLHSYVRGLGIEVLANSDNVVRAGLTSKVVHPAELLRILDTAATGIAGRARRIVEGIEVFDSASDHFLLHRVDPAVVESLPGRGSPRIVFLLRGRARLEGLGRDGRREIHHLVDMESVFLPVTDEDVLVSGHGEIYVASVPPA